MRRLLTTLAVLSLALACRGAARADDEADAKALLDRAIKAAGGREALAKYPAFRMKVKGTLHLSDGDHAFTGEWYYQGTDQARTVIVSESNGVKSREVRVVNGDKGWTKEDDNAAEEMGKDALASEKEELYLNQVTTLVPLEDRASRLKPLGEGKVGTHEAVGLEVSRRGHADVKLFFDKKDGMLLRCATTLKDADTGKEVPQEVLFEDYKEIQGTQQPMTFHWTVGGKPSADFEVTEMKLAEKLDDDLFAKP
jgi:hypothetical protein